MQSSYIKQQKKRKFDDEERGEWIPVKEKDKKKDYSKQRKQKRGEE